MYTMSELCVSFGLALKSRRLGMAIHLEKQSVGTRSNMHENYCFDISCLTDCYKGTDDSTISSRTPTEF